MEEIKNKPDVRVDELFDIRDRLESLTRQYIQNLSSSNQDIAAKAEQLSVILESIGDGLIVFDKDGNVILANNAAVNLARLDPEHMSRRELLQQFEFYRDEKRTLISTEEFPFEVAFRERRPAKLEGLATGPSLPSKGLWVSVTASPIIGQDGEISGVVTTFHDITERVRMQQQRDSLATLITHDIKNHFAASSAFLDQFREEFESKLGDDDLGLLAKLEESNQGFLNVANTLLEIYRTDIAADAHYATSVDMNELLDSVVRFNRLTAEDREIVLQLQVDGALPTLLGIPTALRQVVHNLVQNAVNASPRGETVDLRASSSEGIVLIEVEDRGPGMSEEMISKLFDQKTVLRALPFMPSSSGFGLYLSQMLVEAHEGKIYCKSKQGSGTTFCLELPVKSRIRTTNPSRT